MKRWEEENDFIHHEKNAEIDELIDFQQIRCFFLKSELYANKNAYQLFEVFTKKLKENSIEAEILKVIIGKNTLIEKDSEKNTEKEPEKTTDPDPELNKYLKNFLEVKKSLEPFEKTMPNCEFYELDIPFYRYVFNLLRENLMVPQEYLYRIGGYKPVKRNSSKTKSKKNKPVDCNVEVEILFLFKRKKSSEENKTSIISQLRNALGVFFRPNYFEKTKNSMKKEILQVEIKNFRYGLFEENSKAFAYLWDMENLNNINTEIRRKTFVMNFEENNREISIFFLLKLKKKMVKLASFFSKFQ